MNEEVLVIGAGPAGIASAYYLEQAHIAYTIVDKANVLASTWDSLYPSLRLNTTRFYSHLPGRKFPLSYGLFPTAKQYHRYLEQYVADHRFAIQLGVTVTRVAPEGDGWRVDTSAGSHRYPAIISATGRFNKPYWPRIPGMEHFGGRLLHAHDYVDPRPFAGQRVMVVGNGPSGVDISTELGRVAARPVLLAQRTGVVLRPRYPYGLPKHLWMLMADYLPDRIARPLMARVERAQFRNLDQIGIKVPTTEADTSAAGATRGYELIRAVKAGHVRSVDGPACFEPDAVVLSDGSRHAVDAVILATGYRPALFDYLEIDAETDKDGWPLRIDEPPQDVAQGKRQVAGYPGLYLVGVFYQGKGAMYNFNTEARAAVEEIRQYLAGRSSRS